MIDQSLAYERARAELGRRILARRNFADYVPLVNPNYTMMGFHHTIADNLQKVLNGEIKKLAVFVPPQHGKSELATRMFPSYVLGRKNKERIAICSYGASLALGFSKAVQRYIDSDEYRKIFPSIRLPKKGEADTANEKWEIIVKDEDGEERIGGSVKAVGVEGPITGEPVDLLIIDDPVKDRQDAQSPKVREGVWEWYVDAAESRLHNHSRQILIQTRWDEDDLSGRVLRRDGIWSPSNPNGWVVISFPAIKTRDVNTYDKRKEGEVLWEERHSLERMLRIKEKNPLTFDSLYQQDPKPSQESLIYSTWSEIPSFPTDCEAIFYGLDFGFENDPTALIKVGRKGKNIYLDEVIYETGLSNTDIRLRAEKAGVGMYEIFADLDKDRISSLKFPQDIDGRRIPGRGLNVVDAIKGPNSISPGISKLKEYDVFYTARSVNIAYEKNHYVWIFMGGKNTNIPIDADNHAMDAVRYAVTTKYKKGRYRRSLTYRR